VVVKVAQEADRGVREQTEVRLKRVDCDVHPNFLESWPIELSPYMSREWGIRFRGGEEYKGADAGERGSVRFSMPHNYAYPRRGTPMREDLMGPGGTAPATDSTKAAEDLLDGCDIDRAILVPQGTLSIGTIPNPEAAAVIASATNDWLAERWLAADPRWRGTIVVAAQDPRRAADEIRRCAANQSFVGVYMPLTNILMGHPNFSPIYEVAEEFSLPIVLHTSGSEGLYTTAPSLAGGVPFHHIEMRMTVPHCYQANLVSLVGTGAFERFPTLRVVCMEVGYAWVPELMWRMDAFWKSGREDTPWIKRLPSEYMIDHCRFTTQPFVEPNKHKYIAQIFDMFNAERTLMFSTDYPHWDSEEPFRVENLIPEEIRQRVLADNALEVFGDRLL
jgi:predicted TIM-barrel fold metal-dependent hydrolase